MHDITRSLDAQTPLWPGSEPFALHACARMTAGDACNVTAVTLDLHAGSHLDTPWHVRPDGGGLEAFSLEVLCGPATLIRIERPVIGAADLAPLVPTGCERLLLQTTYSLHPPQPGEAFRTDFPALTLDAAQWLAAHGLRLIGIDSPSIESFRSRDLEVHKTLLAKPIAVLEHLDLAHVAPGAYRLVALPLPLPSPLDASPLRAVLFDDVPAPQRECE